MSIESLKQEKQKLAKRQREIDRQIKELRDGARYAGSVKLDYQRYPTRLPDMWSVCVKVPVTRYPEDQEKYRWQPITRSPSKDDTIEQFSKLLSSLIEFYNDIKEGTTNEQSV